MQSDSRGICPACEHRSRRSLHRALPRPKSKTGSRVAVRLGWRAPSHRGRRRWNPRGGLPNWGACPHRPFHSVFPHVEEVSSASPGDDVPYTEEDRTVNDDTETKVASEVKAALARYGVLDSDLLRSLRALPRADASNLAAELRAVANDVDSGSRVAVHPWSFPDLSRRRPGCAS